MNKKYMLGVFFIILSSIGFSSLQLFVKLADDLSIYNKIFYRNIVITLITYLLIRYKKESLRVDKSEWKLLFLRFFFGTLGIYINFYTAMYIKLGDATIIQKLSSFILLILAYFFFKEKFTKVQFLALCISFIGVMLIIKPGTESFSLGHIIALLGAICIAFAYICLRALGIRGKVNPLVIVFYFSIFTSIVFFPFAIMSLPEFTTRHILMFLAIGISGGLGQYGITFAYKFASPKDISVYEYTQVLFASILGYVVLNEVPDVYTFVGYLIIISVGIYIFFYERKLKNNKE